MYRLADISKLWAEAEIYPGERELMKIGDRISVRIAGFEDAPSEALITFVSPGVSQQFRGYIDKRGSR